MIANDLDKLRQEMLQAAKRHASADVANARVYLCEAHEFASLVPPQTVEELTIREAEAATLGQRSAERLKQSQGP